MEFKRKNIISISELTAEEIIHILDTASSMKEVTSRDMKKVPTLKGVTVVNLFLNLAQEQGLLLKLQKNALALIF